MIIEQNLVPKIVEFIAQELPQVEAIFTTRDKKSFLSSMGSSLLLLGKKASIAKFAECRK
jgi:hypothetical protein